MSNNIIGQNKKKIKPETEKYPYIVEELYKQEQLKGKFTIIDRTGYKPVVKTLSNQKIIRFDKGQKKAQLSGGVVFSLPDLISIETKNFLKTEPELPISRWYIDMLVAGERKRLQTGKLILEGKYDYAFQKGKGLLIVNKLHVSVLSPLSPYPAEVVDEPVFMHPAGSWRDDWQEIYEIIREEKADRRKRIIRFLLRDGREIEGKLMKILPFTVKIAQEGNLMNTAYIHKHAIEDVLEIRKARKKADK